VAFLLRGDEYDAVVARMRGDLDELVAE